MRYRQYPRTGWELSEIGYGMWGLGGWTGSDDAQTLQSLAEAIALGCNFFDTAWAYGAGHSERLLGQTLRAHRDRRLYVATKVPPKNQRWIQLDDCALDDVFPSDHIRAYTEASLENLGVDTIDLQQLHAWSDRWADRRALAAHAGRPEREGLVRSWGISVNRWETDQRRPSARHRPHRLRAGRLQHLRPGSRRRAVPLLPGARHRGHRARAV